MEYIGSIQLIVDGKTIDDFKSFKEGELIHRRRVDVMNGAGTAVAKPKYNLTVTYVIPKNPDNVFDFSGVSDGTLKVLDDEGNEIHSYTGVSCLSEGEQTMDGDNDSVRDIQLMATGRD